MEYGPLLEKKLFFLNTLKSQAPYDPKLHNSEFSLYSGTYINPESLLIMMFNINKIIL